jgi:uncharacterized protein (TIRG00374 family)
MKKMYWNLYKVVIGLSILIFLFLKVGIANIGRLLIGFDFEYVIPIIISLALIFFWEVLNIKVLISKINSVGYFKLFKYHLLSWSVGLFVPGKIGQFSIIPLLKKEGVGMGKGSAIILIDKFMTLLTLSILALCGFFIFFSVKQAFTIFGILIVLALVVIFSLKDKSRSFIKKFILRKHAIKFEGFSKTMKFYLKDCKKRLLLNFLITMIKWATSATMIFLLFLSFNYFVDYYKILLITPMGVLVSFIPISLSGLGIRESTVAFLYSQIGVSSVAVVSVYLVNLVINYIVGAVSATLFLHEFGKHT